jgi:hypothetical protein
MKYQVIISFHLTEAFMSKVPAHRAVIDNLINEHIIESYTVSLVSERSWIVMNANSEDEVMDYLRRSPLFDEWEIEIEELFVYDSIHLRWPETSLN